jgi:hypothetical protein
MEDGRALQVVFYYRMCNYEPKCITGKPLDGSVAALRRYSQAEMNAYQS